ncbi:MAG: ribonuclease D [Gammaproteobacteria bacterium]|jgi:ribonuclease D|nr:ribonuclease D [Gammaproteobacteria bacterium]
MREVFVDNSDQLQQLCEELQSEPVMAMDTEFLREKTYYAQLCLVQIATPHLIACIDPIQITDISPFLKILYDPDKLKVMHSARQDLELFHDITQQVPTPLFDTQIAATLLGFGDQLGYANLIEKLLGIKLAKTHTRTDWSHRPLGRGQIEYAMDDVRYLLQVHHIQTEALAQLGRSDWLQKDFAALTDPKLYQQPMEDLWQKVRGANTLKGVQLAVLQHLTRWREHQAIEKNRPRRWILRDDVLVEIARQLPQSSAALMKIPGSDGYLQKNADAVLAEVEQGKAVPSSEWPSLAKFTRLTSEQEAKVDLLMAVVRTRAAQAHVTPSVLASRKELECLVQGKHKQRCAVMWGWRAELVGNELQAILDGERHVYLDSGEIKVQTDG